MCVCVLSRSTQVVVERAARLVAASTVPETSALLPVVAPIAGVCTPAQLLQLTQQCNGPRVSRAEVVACLTRLTAAGRGSAVAQQALPAAWTALPDRQEWPERLAAAFPVTPLLQVGNEAAPVAADVDWRQLVLSLVHASAGGPPTLAQLLNFGRSAQRCADAAGRVQVADASRLAWWFDSEMAVAHLAAFGAAAPNTLRAVCVGMF